MAETITAGSTETTPWVPKGLPGVSVTLSKQGEDVPIGADGNVGRLAPGEYTLRIETTTEYTGFTVDLGKNIQLAKNWDRKRGANGRLVLKRTIKVHAWDSGLTRRTFHKVNHLRLRVLTATGFKIYEIGLVAQGRNAWVVCDLTHYGTLYRFGDELFNDGWVDRDPDTGAPTYDDKWPALLDWLKEDATERGLTLPRLVADFVFPSLVDTSALASNQAIVVWYNLCGGRGLVQLASGERVHVDWQDTPKRENGLCYLSDGEKITVDRTAVRTIKNYDETVSYPLTFAKGIALAA